jgi:hypothetical protein
MFMKQTNGGEVEFVLMFQPIAVESILVKFGIGALH